MEVKNISTLNYVKQLELENACLKKSLMKSVCASNEALLREKMHRQLVEEENAKLKRKIAYLQLCS